MEDEGNGANFGIEDLYASSTGLYDTDRQWQYLEWYGKTGADQREITLGVRLGGYSAESVGKAYFDDIELVKVDDSAVPDDVSPSLWYSIASSAAAKTETTTAPQKSTALFCLLALGGDLGCSAGPTLAGMVSAAAGDDLKTGVLAALVFPLVLTLCVLFQHRRASAKKLS